MSISESVSESVRTSYLYIEMYNCPISSTTLTNFDIANFIKLEEPLLSLKLIDIFNTVWYPNQLILLQLHLQNQNI